MHAPRFVCVSRWASAPLILLLAALASGCGSEADDTNPTDVHAEVSEHITTVVNVYWKTADPGRGYVEYGPTKDLGLTTPLSTEKATEQVQPLVGLKADTVYYYRVVTFDGDAGRSPIKSVRTGYLPPGFPEIEVVGSGHDEFIIAPLLGQSRAVLILDPDGDIVWYHDDDDGEDSVLQFYRARLARDGKGVLYNSADISGEPAPNSSIVRVSFDGSERKSIPVPLLAHDFVEFPDGTIGALVIEDRDMDGTLVRGNKIIEIDPEGNQTEAWNTWDCFDPIEHPGDDPMLAWTFTNALDYDSSEDVYYVSVRNLSSIARVSRETRECEWVLGFTASTLEFAPGSAQFQHEHQFQVFGDHLLVMDNEGALQANTSRVLEYQLDFDTNVATEIWSFTSTPPAYTYVLGEPTRMANGDTFITWSTDGQMERVTAAGESIWKLNAKAGGVFGFNTLAKSLYPL